MQPSSKEHDSYDYHSHVGQERGTIIGKGPDYDKRWPNFHFAQLSMQQVDQMLWEMSPVRKSVKANPAYTFLHSARHNFRQNQGIPRACYWR